MRLIELCCGSAAVSMRAIGFAPPLTYQGGKRRQSKQILEAIGIRSRPKSIMLVDIGPFGRTWQAMADPSIRQRVASIIDGFANDPRGNWDRVRRSPIPEDLAEYSAAYLTLQLLNYKSKAVHIKNGRWITHGFNTTTAYGRPASARFGMVSPQLPRLSRWVTELGVKASGVELSAIHGDVLDVAGEIEAGSIVYIDPPYHGTTGYGSGLDRVDLMRLIDTVASVVRIVAVSEAEPLPGAAYHIRLVSRRRGMAGNIGAEWLSIYTTDPKLTEFWSSRSICDAR